jgi:alpha-ketoglutarate-dependent taurine dioxygenase
MDRRFPGAGRRQAVLVGDAGAVRPVAGAGPLPLVVAPVAAGTDLAAWAQAHPGTVRTWLERHGAVLFRGFGADLERAGGIVAALAGPPLEYRERSSPRTAVADRLYTSTDHPADQVIGLHNENSYQQRFPRFLVLCCLAPATSGGATTLADTRAVLRRLDRDDVERFATLGARYLRNHRPGLGLPWQEVYGTASRAAVEEHCAAAGIDLEWTPDGLRTWQRRPALARHPATGERVWFNHVTAFHVSSLAPDVRRALLRTTAPEDLPQQSYFGDGSAIPDRVLDRVRAAYAAERAAPVWERGDVLLVDNLLCAHGREPYTGDRRVVVAMSGALAWRDVAAGEASP